MSELTDVIEETSNLPPGVLLVLAMLAAFALAGYAIYAVLEVAKRGK